MVGRKKFRLKGTNENDHEQVTGRNTKYRREQMQFNDSAAQTPMGSERGVMGNKINIFVGKSFSVQSSVCFLSYKKDKEKLQSVHCCLQNLKLWST